MVTQRPTSARINEIDLVASLFQGFRDVDSNPFSAASGQ
jgi:hypothetical protein